MKTQIQKRVKSARVTPKVGQKVLVTAADGTQYLAEVIELHGKIKNLITKVKVVREDGKVEIQEVADLVVEAVIVLKDIVLSQVFKAAWQWVKNLFSKKEPQLG